MGMLMSEKIAILLGANETYLQMVSDYIFWYSVFLISSTLGSVPEHLCEKRWKPKTGACYVVYLHGS